MWLGKKAKSVLQGLLIIQTPALATRLDNKHWQHGSKLGHHSSRAASRHRIEPLDNWRQCAECAESTESTAIRSIV